MATKPKIQKNNKGQFMPGNVGGPGNPHSKQMNEWRNCFVKCVTKEDMTAVVEKLKSMAIAGDMAAIKYFMDRALGKIPHNINIDAGSALKTYLNVDIDNV